MTTTRVLLLVGSLRSGSHNRQLAEAAALLAPADVKAEIYDGLSEVPFYNEDIDTPHTLPAAASALRRAAEAADAFVLVTPEYNGTMPAPLKNAIDWLSRPYGSGAISGKPVAVIGTAFGRHGGIWAQDEARKAVGVAGGSVVESVNIALPGSVTRFAQQHPADDAEVRGHIATLFAELSTAVSAARA